MQDQRQLAAQTIQQSNNILVTVSANPSVDQLAACIGLTLGLNKLGKHATAVFSGEVPDILKFLNPEKTIEKTTDSLRDFIIALDKTKADKLRYKVEDKVVKIFITPYRTSISDKDLEFSQGDFNVDVVLAVGVHNQTDLDQAITSHGRILHDATVVTVNVKPGGELGNVNWLEPASSLSELSVRLLDTLNKELLDGQIATAMLTGIVSETERFSNALTTPQTMSISAELMAAGANQQLVATKLREVEAMPISQLATPKAAAADKSEESRPEDGTLEITHDDGVKKPAGPQKPMEATLQAKKEEPKEEETEEPAEEEKVDDRKPEFVIEREPEEKPLAPQIDIDEQGQLRSLEQQLPPATGSQAQPISRHNEPLKMVAPPIPGQELKPEPPPEHFLTKKKREPLKPKADEDEMGTKMTPEDDEKPAGGAPPQNSFLVGSQPGKGDLPGSAASASPAPQAAPGPQPQPQLAMSPVAPQLDVSSRLGGSAQGSILPTVPPSAPQAQAPVPGSVPVGPTEQIDGTRVAPQEPAVPAEEQILNLPDLDKARSAVSQAITKPAPVIDEGATAPPVVVPGGDATQLAVPNIPGAPGFEMPAAMSPPPTLPGSAPQAPGQQQQPWASEPMPAPTMMPQPDMMAPPSQQPVPSFPEQTGFGELVPQPQPQQPVPQYGYQTPPTLDTPGVQQQQMPGSSPPPVPPPMMPPTGQF